MTEKIADNVILLTWYNHYNDPHLEEDYDTMQRVFNEHPSIKPLFDCDECGVFSYPDEAHDALYQLNDSLLRPRYWGSWEEFAADYDSDPEDPVDVFGQVRYDAQLTEIGKQAGNDEREFDRLWTEKFVFGADEEEEYQPLVPFY